MSEELREKVERKLRERGFTTLKSAPKSGVYLFFSFDLVNSTQFKNSHSSKWPVIITHFYDLVAAEMSTRFTSAILWKYSGDEVLFYKRIHSRQDFPQLLPSASAVLSSVISSLHRLHPETRSILSVKGSVWIADVEYLPPAPANRSVLSKRNMITPVTRLSESTGLDFLGPEIDTGFRIAAFVKRNRLVVSAHLAGVLYNQRQNCAGIEKQLKIVSYEPLKGVWNGRHYPIIWYEQNWEKVDQTFLYDEHFTSDLVAKIRNGACNASDFALENIQKIFDDLGKEDELNAILAALDKTEPEPANEEVEIVIPENKRSEVHCVAVCFTSTGKVLLGRRPPTKKRYPGCWEFGCGQLQLGDDFDDCLRKAYREDFGAELEFHASPTPVSTFKISDPTERRNIPGIIFATGLKNPEEVESRFHREKHTEIKFVDPESLDLRPEECVPDLAETIRKAAAAWLRRPENSTR